MVMEIATEDSILVPDAPQLPGLRFRLFRGEQDFPLMITVAEASCDADGIERAFTVENMAATYANLKNCDPYKDCVLVEVDGEVVGYKRVDWYSELDGTRLYNHFGFLR